MKGVTTAWGPTLIHHWGSEQKDETNPLPIQVSVHDVASRSFLNELKEIFPNISWAERKNMTIVCTMQHSVMELVRVGTEVENEKDKLLENFVSFAKKICEQLQASGHFADYFDPCSGLPALYTDSNKVFSEVFCAQSLLGYSIMNAGCCKILLHPDWGSAVYPASLVTTAPAEDVSKIIESLR